MNFRNKSLKRLKITIDPDAQFHEIFSTLNEISFSSELLSQDNVMYAILELVNNSLRAMREAGGREHIQIVFLTDGPRLNIEVTDRAGGFDPYSLPFQLDEAVDGIDLNSHRFLEYRRRHNNLRFGMGLYIAKRTFSDFELVFHDANGHIRPWGAPDIVGTHIRLSLMVTSSQPLRSEEAHA